MSPYILIPFELIKVKIKAPVETFVKNDSKFQTVYNSLGFFMQCYSDLGAATRGVL